MKIIDANAAHGALIRKTLATKGMCHRRRLKRICQISKRYKRTRGFI